MILKHRDTEVLRFDWVEPFGVKNVEVSSAAERFLPLAFRDRIRPGDAKALTWAVEDWIMARKSPVLYSDWLQFPGGVTDEMIDRLRLLKGFRFKHDKSFLLPPDRMEVIQYFLQNRIAKIVDYGCKADRFIKIGSPDDTIKREDERSSSPEDLRAMIVAALKLFPTISRQQLSERLEIGPATVARHVKALQDAGELKRVGSRKTGYWQVVEKSPNH